MVSADESADSLDERTESVTNAVLAALLAEITTLSKDRPPHTAAVHTAPPPTAELIAASKERGGRSDYRGVVVRDEAAWRDAAGRGRTARNELPLPAERDGRDPRDTSSQRTGIGGGLPQTQPSALQHPSTLPELLADIAECGARVAASTEQCRASTGAMRAEMASFAAAMQTSPANTPPRREDSREDSPSSSGARIVIRARGHGVIGFVRLPLAPLAADCRPADATGSTPGVRDRRAGPACHDCRAELIGDCSPGGKPGGVTFAAVRAAIAAQLGEDLSAVAHALPAGACNSKVDRCGTPLPHTHSGLHTSL